tara:strand:- start:629 stop:1885 length:1257 start_codon:yes stop_codon:yes gene_type:complete
MNVTGTLPSGFKDSIINIELIVDSPYSGFELSLMESGKFNSSKLVTFSGSEGVMFDQSGNFFGGYKSGSALDLKVHYDYSSSGFAYYFEDTLIANNLETTGVSDGATDSSINAVSFTKHGNSTVSIVAKGDARTTLAKEATDQIELNITDSMDLATNGSMFVDYTDPAGTLEGGGFNASRSNNFWGKDIDFTAVSVWNNRGFDSPKDFRKIAATAITKRHIVMAEHFKLVAGDIVYFSDSNGTWVARTVQAISDHASADITVGVLSEELPETVKPVKVVPSNINTYFRRNTSSNLINNFFKPIGVCFDFEKKGILMELSSANDGSNDFAILTSNSIPIPFRNLSESIVAGDSGNPCFLIIDGEAILIGTFRTSSKGPAFANYISDINTLIAAADSAASITTNLVLTEAKLPLSTYFGY